jgi:hypothetical protein
MRMRSGAAALAIFLVFAGGSASGAPPQRNDLRRCPKFAGFSPNSTQRRAMLVPRGPIRLVVCRYSGTAPQARAVIINYRPIHTVTGDLNHLPELPNRNWATCPESDGTILAVILYYRTLPSKTVWIEANGCQLVKAGQQRRWAYFRRGRELIRRLEALTDCQPRTRPGLEFGCR